MKVNYTLPGVLPEPTRLPAGEIGESPIESFSAKLRRLRTPVRTSWRALLRLDSPPAGATAIGPPPPPLSLDLRDGASQRAWWRTMLDKHARFLDSLPPGAAESFDGADYAAMGRMVALLTQCQRLEEDVFARHLAEGAE